MITDDRFLQLVDQTLKRHLSDPANRAQREAVTYSADDILHIVAGPGSGKTTVLVLRALRCVLVEGILPEHILITTFTRKAAQELRTRWLDWGTILLNALQPDHCIDHIDINRCRIDTLDATIQNVLTEYRPAGELPPALADAAASLLILKREVFQDLYWPNKDTIDPLLSRYTFDGRPPKNQREALHTTKRLLERLIQDRVDTVSYARTGDAEEIVVDILERYRTLCIETNIFDFTTLEEHFLCRLISGDLGEWSSNIRMLLVDEYQDTNSIQEEIYFALADSASPSTTVVGDDDQSMYRFRGGSVELFTEFASRWQNATGRATTRIDMVRNFRSKPDIVDFFNRHISSDQRFQTARINPPKPLVIAAKGTNEIPVLGMFRADEDTLATDLAMLLRRLTNHNPIPAGNGRAFHLAPDGALGDAVFLAHSVEEIAYDQYGKGMRPRFSGIFRAALENLGLQVFNPRGQALRSIEQVQILLGLVLISIDPDATIVSGLGLTTEVQYFLRQWRARAATFMGTNPAPNDGHGITGFISEWQSVALGKVSKKIPSDWPVLELLFTLLTWMPSFQTEPEHQVWLEAVMRIVSSATTASPYNMQILQNNKDARAHGVHVRRSRESLVRDALAAIAANEVDVDEEIMPSVPRDRLPFMTIHQSKGLEFPLVIVDVGSRFKSDHWTQRFLRFPQSISSVVQAEDDIEPYLASPIRSQREGLDRTFDDLVRLYYVAYSRSQSILLLVGNEAGLRYGPTGAIRNIALGWHRDETWPWRQPYTTKRPPVKVNPPFLEI